MAGYESYAMNAGYGGYPVPASNVPPQIQSGGYGVAPPMGGGPQAPVSHTAVSSGGYGAPPVSQGYGVQGGYYQQPVQPSDPVQNVSPYAGPPAPSSMPQQPYGQLPAASYGQTPAQPVQAGGYGIQQPPAAPPVGGYYGAQATQPQMPQSGYYPGAPQPGPSQPVPQYGQPFPGAPPQRMMRGGGPPQPMFRGGPRGGFGGYSGGGEFNSNFEDENAIRPDTVHVSNLPTNLADHEKLKEHFGVVGKIKMNAKTGMPMIWIFKEAGVPRGDAVITYESNAIANSAVKHFQDNGLAGHKVEVRLATNAERPKIVPPGGGAGGAPSAAPRGGMSSRGRGGFENGQGFSRGGFAGPRRGAPNGARGSSASGRGGGSGGASRDGDWTCSDCGNSNFAWRDACNRCQSGKSDGAGGPMRGGARAPRPAPY